MEMDKNKEMDAMEEFEMNQGEENPMPSSLEEFLFEHPIENETSEIVLCSRLKDFKFQIGTMTQNDRKRYIDACLIRAKNGVIVKQDLVKFNELVVLNHCLYPNFKSLDFVRKCGKKTPTEALYSRLKTGEIETLAQKIMEFNGFDSTFDDLREQAKN